MDTEQDKRGSEPAPEGNLLAIVDALRSIEDLSGLTDEELRWIAIHGTERQIVDGELIFSQGTPPHHLIFLLSGEVAIKRHTSSPVSVLAGHTGRITGKTPFSRMRAWNADGRATGNVWLLELHDSRFDEMLKAIPSMTERVVRVLIDRNREYTRAEEQIGKLSALSKLAANLAHELNNPAAAARSAALALSQRSRLRKEKPEYRIGQEFQSEAELRIYLNGLEALCEIFDAKKTALSPLDISELEETLSQWLEKKKFEDPWSLAPILAEANVTTDQLGSFLNLVPAHAHILALQDLRDSLAADRAANSILEACERIFRIVAAIKDYSYMDREPLQVLNVPEALENVLSLFHPRLKDVQIVKKFGLDLPLLTGFGSEIKQAFAAIVENALDAMEDSGTLELCVKQQDKSIVVEFSDNGHGIAAEFCDRVFEPFFTTKPFGKGLGLGLDTVQRVVTKHFGAVSVRSKPHATTFEIRLPLDRAEIY